MSTFTKTAHPEIAWREITGTRRRLIHDYGEVRLDLVWMVLRDRLPPLLAILQQLAPREDGADDGPET